MISADDLPVDTLEDGVTARNLAETIFGRGVSVQNATYSGDPASAGIFRDGLTQAQGATPSDTGVILSTGHATDYTNASGQANQSPFTSTNSDEAINPADFAAIAGAPVYDSAYLDVDFIPNGDVMAMQFVFASEEYPEFQTSLYQDFVTVWVNGNPVALGTGNGDVDPGNLNPIVNENLFIDNTGDAFNTEMDGLSITLGLTIPVNAGEVNTIRIGIADVLDQFYDSNLLIAAGSAQTLLVAVDDDVDLNPFGSATIDVLQNDLNETSGLMFVTHINGVEVWPGDSVTLATGQTVTLSLGWTLTIDGDGDDEDFSFTYAITNGDDTDTAIVNIASVPCFVAGTLIDTSEGPIPVEDLRPGMNVLTRDEGPQPLRWIGQRSVPADGAFAPIRFDRNALGRHDALMLSPEHRVLIRDGAAELLFGEHEVLIAAKHLLNGRSIRRAEGGMVTYVHLLFDRHQVVYSAGLATESFLPGPQTQSLMTRETLREITALFPELDPKTGAGYGPAARRTLRHFEADLFLRSRWAA